MNLGEILDRTFQIYRARFLVFAGIAAVPALATMCLEVASYLLWGSYPAYTLNLGFGITVAELGSMLGFYHFGLFFQLLFWPSFVYAASGLYDREKRSLTIRSAVLASATSWRRSVASSSALFACVLVAPELINAIVFLGITYLFSEVLKFDSDTMDLVLTPLLVLFCVLGWASIGWMSAELSFVIPSRTLEGLSARNALRRSWTLTSRSRFRIFVAWLMPAILGWVFYLAASRSLFLLRSSCTVPVYEFINSYQFRLIAAVVPWHGWCVSPSAVEAISIVSEAAISTLLGPIFPIAITLFYYDQRIRHEGYDIERMMDAAGMNAPGPSIAGDGASTPVAEESEA
jgi:hypothetical protein